MNEILDAGKLKQLIEARQRNHGKWSMLYQAMDKTHSEMTELEQKLKDALTEIPEAERLEFFGNQQGDEAYKTCLAKVRECAEAYGRAAEDYRKLSELAGRNTVDIAMIGNMGNGKSLLMRSTCGRALDKYIPSGGGDSLTAVTTIIYNNPEYSGEKPCITLTLKTDAEIIGEINEDLKALSDAPEDPPRIQTLERAEIERAYGNPGLQQGEKSREGYVKNWQQWRELKADPNLHRLGSPDAKGHQRYQLRNPEELITYIGKHKGDNFKQYYHVAVLEAQIETRMPGINVPFKLIDTVGVNDDTTETRKRIEYAANEERDAIVYTYRYPSRTDGLTEAAMQMELAELRTLFNGQRNRDASNRFAFLLNVPRESGRGDWVRDYFSETDTTGIDPQDITDHVKTLQDFIRLIKDLKEPDGEVLSGENGNRSGIKLRVSADISSPGQVRTFLRRFLQQLINTMQSRGEIFERNARGLERAAKEAREELVGSLDNLLYHVSGQNDISKVHGILESRQGRLIEDLCALRNELHKDEPSPLEYKLNLVRQFADGKCPLKVPSLDEIVRDSAKQLGKHRELYALERLHASIWKIASLKYDGSQDMERECKWKAEEAFRAKLGIPHDRWEEDFFLSLSQALYQEGVRADIWQAFQDFHDFHPDSSNSIEHSIFLRYANQSMSVLRGEENRLPVANAEAYGALRTGTDRWGQDDDEPDFSQSPADDRQSAPPEIPTDEDELKGLLKGNLDNFVSDITRDYFRGGKDVYSIAPDQQIRDHLEKLVTCLYSPYLRNDWLVALYRLYERGFLSLDKPGFKESREALEQVIRNAKAQNRAETG